MRKWLSVIDVNYKGLLTPYAIIALALAFIYYIIVATSLPGSHHLFTHWDLNLMEDSVAKIISNLYDMTEQEAAALREMRNRGEPPNEMLGYLEKTIEAMTDSSGAYCGRITGTVYGVPANIERRGGPKNEDAEYYPVKASSDKSADDDLLVDLVFHFDLSSININLVSGDGLHRVVLNQKLVVKAHSDEWRGPPGKRFVGLPLSEVGKEYSEIYDELISGAKPFFTKIIDIDGEFVLVKFRRGQDPGLPAPEWYFGLIVPADNLVRSIKILAAIFFFFFLFLVFVLTFILLRSFGARMRAEEETRFKSSVLAKMSHEIRTPLHIITEMSKLALKNYGQPQGRNYIERIKQNGRYLHDTIGDIIDGTERTSGKLHIRVAPYEPASLFDNEIESIRYFLRKKDIEFTTDITPDIPRLIMGDEARVHRILRNLLVNASKYTEEGFIKLTVRCQREAEGSLVMTFTVADSGSGIRPENMGGLFEESSGSAQGTGLGLPITKELCRAMGGDITVESEYGEGSKFTAAIRQSIADCPPMGGDPDNTMQKSVPRGVRVLIVDDNDDNREIITQRLKDYGLEVDAAESGEEALELAGRNVYAMVFMDILMDGGMDGDEAMQALKKIPGHDRTPVVAMTAQVMAESRKHFLEHDGFDDFLPKSKDFDALDTIINKWIPPEPSPELTSGAIRQELTLRLLNDLRHCSYAAAKKHPVGRAFCETVSGLLDRMDVPPQARLAAAALSAALRNVDEAEVRRLLPEVYDAIAAAALEKKEGQRSTEVFEETLRQLKTALDKGDSQGIEAGRYALMTMDTLSSRERELVFRLNNAIFMDNTEQAALELEAWVSNSRPNG